MTSYQRPVLVVEGGRVVYLTPEELHVLASAITSDRGYEFANDETEAVARPLAAGRAAAEWYERPEYGWDE